MHTMELKMEHVFVEADEGLTRADGNKDWTDFEMRTQAIATTPHRTIIVQGCARASRHGRLLLSEDSARFLKELA